MTICSHCKGTSWKISELSPMGANFKYYAVQCQACDVPAGIMDYDNIGTALEELEAKVDGITDNLATIGQALNQIIQRLSVS